MVLFKVTASKFSLPKVETMRKSYYLNDNIFQVESVLEKISNISLNSWMSLLGPFHNLEGLDKMKKNRT
jgi:hypothetical protein